MNFHINGHDDWATAPPSLRGQVFFNAMFCSRAVGSKGVTSPPIGILNYVQEQPQKFAVWKGSDANRYFDRT